MIVVIAGIKRSGSTVQYNLVRLALEQAGWTVHGQGQIYNPRTFKHGKVCDLVKIHPFRAKIAARADHIFLTNRNPQEIKESLDRFNDTDTPWERFFRLYKDLISWSLRTDTKHYFTYEQWMNNPDAFAERIVKVLGVKADPKKVLAEFNKISPPDNGQDPITLMYSNHITKI